MPAAMNGVRLAGPMRVAAVTLLLLFAVLPAGVAAAASHDSDDRIVVKGPVRIAKGDTAGDVVVLDGPVTVAGRVRGDLVVVSGGLTIRGRVDGDVFTVADRARLAPRARVGGDLGYANKRPVVPRRARVGGEVKRLDPGKIGAPLGAGVAIGLWIAVSVSTLVLGLLLLLLSPRAADATHEAARERLGASIGFGLLLFFGIPILALLALVTIVGVPLGVGLLLALLPLYAIGYTTSAWLLGRRLLGPPRGRVLSFLAGLVILRLLALVPFLSSIVWFIATVLGLGALLVATRRARSGGVAPRAAPGAQPSPQPWRTAQ